MSCPFCNIERERWLSEFTHSVAIWDVFPVAVGHALIVPRRHVQSIFELTLEEMEDLWMVAQFARHKITEKYGVHSFNIGINEGVAAGQTVPHAHVHIIPRREGDVADPRGGVRWVLPEHAKYWD